MTLSTETRALFFREFLKELIVNSLPKLQIQPIAQPAKAFQRQIPRFAQIPPMIKRISIKPILRQPRILPQTLIKQMPQQKEYQKSTPYETELGKLRIPLADPAVLGVECPGQDKPILVNRSGVIQATSIMLTKDEISHLIDYFSAKAKIPAPETGIFKAIVGNLIISAVLSPVAGSRFVIQKQTPLTTLYS